jgi:hypothetical protein
MGLLRAAQIDEETLDRVYHLYREAPRAASMPGRFGTRGATPMWRSRFWASSTRCERWASAGRCSGGSRPRRTPIIPMRWARRPDRAPRAGHGRDARCLCAGACGRSRRNRRRAARWNRCGFAGPMAMWAGSSTATRPLGRCRTSRSSGCWGRPRPPVCHCRSLWRSRYLTDASAPAKGTRRGAGRWFVARHARRVGVDPSERVHPSAQSAASQRGVSIQGATPA